jgi:hypothetical protein
MTRQNLECVMCGAQAYYRAIENGEPLCERDYKNNVEARHKK